MYMYYLLGWRLDTRFYQRWLNGEGQDQAQIEREKEVGLTGTQSNVHTLI